jgi:hypothetical protein
MCALARLPYQQLRNPYEEWLCFHFSTRRHPAPFSHPSFLHISSIKPPHSVFSYFPLSLLLLPTGFGGRKALKKQNDAYSAANMDDYKPGRFKDNFGPRKGGVQKKQGGGGGGVGGGAGAGRGGSPGGGGGKKGSKGGKPQRLGKQRRQAMKGGKGGRR